MDYQYKSKPFAHQHDCFMESRDAEYWGILFEMGVGKSKVGIDTAAYLYGRGRINSLVIFAPNGVHRKWKDEDIPFSMPDYIDYKVAVWDSSDKHALEACEKLFEKGDHLRILCVNVEGMSYDALPKFMKRFLTYTDAMVIVDESTRIKSPSAGRTKNIMKLKNLMKYRRIMAGDAVVNTPFDLFSQIAFLDEDILGSSYPAFKSEYAELVDKDSRLMQAIMKKSKARFAPQIVAKNEDGTPRYRNLDKLKELISPFCTRVSKADALDLPPKIYEKRYFKLDPKQRKMYDQMAEDSRFELNDTTVPILHKLTLMLRLQQMTAGFVTDINGNKSHLFGHDHKKNPRVAALLDVLEDIEGSVIIWCRFQDEIRMISSILGDECVTYYGGDSTDDRKENLTAFREGKVKYFVGTAAAGGIGLNLTVSATAIYYSNSFNGGDRFQSEDRCHRIGTTADRVLYIDIEAEDTIDNRIIAALRTKKDMGLYMMELSHRGEKVL